MKSLSAAPKLSEEEIEIYSAIGLAHTRWAELEDMLCHVFREAVSPQNFSPAKGESPADAAFWEITSFEVRLGMTDAAVKKRLPLHPVHPPATVLERSAAILLSEWKRARQRTGERNRNRNRLAHGSVTTLDGQLVYVPYFYGELRRYGHVYFPETGARIMSSLPEERLNKYNILSISRGFQVGTERLRRFLVALRAHNRAQFQQDEETRRFFAEAQARAAQTSTINQPSPSQG